ncbi:hypothetical protein A5780_30505 [Nocardia sp. 852002-20019_SCH5090214]|uniref:PspA-associated protein PspAB n=1 Tax=Nocardia TaxID=1817 RepID=UPI0007A55D21|nr:MULTISPECIES: hypothetical protein [Nocardia]MCC3316734.1 hypothetical protein [Nocardia africana]OBA50935.1 hypothetical protein A5780_30505 [Nocardia sp. 852002-20019_SCH5090214]
MGFLDALLGRSKPVQPNLDVLFAIPPAAYTLQAALDVHPTGAGAVCFKQAEGAGARQSEAEILALLHLEPTTAVAVTTDGFGYTWITCRQDIADLSALVTALHAVNSTLSDNGFGPNLLCTVIGFATADAPPHRLGLVYLFKRGTIYPFAPSGEQRRDNTFELQVRAALSGELPIEAELEHWFPLWDAPVP